MFMERQFTNDLVQVYFSYYEEENKVRKNFGVIINGKLSNIKGLGHFISLYGLPEIITKLSSDLTPKKTHNERYINQRFIECSVRNFFELRFFNLVENRFNYKQIKEYVHNG